MRVERDMFKSLQLPKAFRTFINKGHACCLLAFFCISNLNLRSYCSKSFINDHALIKHSIPLPSV